MSITAIAMTGMTSVVALETMRVVNKSVERGMNRPKTRKNRKTKKKARRKKK